MQNWAYEESGRYVAARADGAWTVYRPAKSGTHAESDSTYPAGADGLGLAIARVMYLARGKGGRDMAQEARALAESWMAKGKTLGARNRAARLRREAEQMEAGAAVL